MIDHSSSMSSELSLQIFYLLYFKLIHLIRFNIIFLQFHGEHFVTRVLYKGRFTFAYYYEKLGFYCSCLQLAMISHR